MKIRTGFVSNSSSSSFIVAFDKKPENKEELRKLLNIEHAKEKTRWRDSIEPEVLLNIVWKDLINQKPNDKKEILEAIGYENWTKEWHENITYEEFIDHEDKDYLKNHLDEMNSILEEFKEKELYCFYYSDEDGPIESFLEHGNIFENFDGIVKSWH